MAAEEAAAVAAVDAAADALQQTRQTAAVSLSAMQRRQTAAARAEAAPKLAKEMAAAKAAAEAEAAVAACKARERPPPHFLLTSAHPDLNLNPNPTSSALSTEIRQAAVILAVMFALTPHVQSPLQTSSCKPHLTSQA